MQTADDSIAGFQSLSPEALCERITAGDRDAMAYFVAVYGPSIRQRFRRRLSSSLRRLLDSGDLLSTISRRLDHMVAMDRIHVDNERQLWGLVHQIARSAIVDKARLLKRIQAAEADERHWTMQLERRVSSAEDSGGFDDVINRAFDALEQDIDQRILAMWLGESTYAQMADATSLSEVAVRQRWRRIRVRLAEAFRDQ